MKSVKTILIAAVSLASLAAPAVAADMRMPVKAAPVAPAPVFSWTGCYIGGNVGGAWSRQDQTRLTQLPATVSVFDYGSETDTGFTGGGQVGCDYQFSGGWVVGARGMWNWTDLHGQHALAPPFQTFTMDDRTRWFATATARLGYAFQPAFLVYVQGGAAWVRNSDTLLLPAGGGVSEAASWTRTGWTAGGGFEYAFMPNVSIFAEYNYMDFGNPTITFIAPPGFNPPGETVSVKQRVHAAMVGINFRWGPK